MARDPSTQQFGNYLEREDLPRIEEWAAFCRVRVGINTNMRLERFFGTFKMRFLQRKANARLDELIFRLLQYLTNKMQELMVKEIRGKTTDVVTLIHKTHTLSLQIPVQNIQQISPNTWSVVASDSKSRYIVKSNSESTCDTNCPLSCKECNSFIHAYVCTCPNNTTRQNMCKHIHAVHQSFETIQQQLEPDLDFHYLSPIPANHLSLEPEPSPNQMDIYEQMKAEIDELLQLSGHSNAATGIALKHMSQAKNELISLISKDPLSNYGVSSFTHERKCHSQIRY